MMKVDYLWGGWSFLCVVYFLFPLTLMVLLLSGCTYWYNYSLSEMVMMDLMAGLGSFSSGMKFLYYPGGFHFFFSLYFLILFCGIMGMFPFSFSFLGVPYLIVCVSIPCWLLTFVLSVSRAFRARFSSLLEGSIPTVLDVMLGLIEILSIMIRPVTLSARILVNCWFGIILLKLFFLWLLSSVVLISESDVVNHDYSSFSYVGYSNYVVSFFMTFCMGCFGWLMYLVKVLTFIGLSFLIVMYEFCVVLVQSSVFVYLLTTYMEEIHFSLSKSTLDWVSHV